MRAALHHLLALLPGADQEEATTSACIAAELGRFDDHLRHTCGAAQMTCTYRCRHVAAFLASCFGTEPLEIGRLTAGDIDAFLKGLAARWKPASRKVICTSLRSYFRFRALLGKRRADTVLTA